jgi:hypothetical protein
MPVGVNPTGVTIKGKFNLAIKKLALPFWPLKKLNFPFGHQFYFAFPFGHFR